MTIKTEQLQIRVSTEQKRALKAFAEAADMDMSNYVLSRVLPSGQQTFDALLEALSEREIHGIALAELNDFLTELSPMAFELAVGQANLRSLSPFLRNYVAAMVEVAASRKGRLAPTWVLEIPPLEQPFFASELHNLRLYLLHTAPVPFKRRNLFVDSSIGDRV